MSRKRTAVIVGVAAAYLLTAFIVEWSFIPKAMDVVYDARRARPFLENKTNELMPRQRGSWSTMLEKPLGLSDDSKRENAENYLPMFLVRGMSLMMRERLAYNLLHLVAWLLAGLSVFAFSRELGASRPGAFLGGLLFLLSPIFRGALRYDSLDFGMVFWLPLLGWALMRVIRRGRKRDVLVAGLVAAGLSASNYYYLILGVLMGGGLLIGAAVFSPPETRFGEVKRLMWVVCVGGLISAPNLLSSVRFLEGSYRAQSTLGYVHSSLSSSFVPIGFTFYLWIAVLAPLAAVAVWRPSNRPGGGFRRVLVGVLVILCGLFGVLQSGQESVGWFVDAMPLIWRIQRLDMLWMLPAVLVCVLAGVGISSWASGLSFRRGLGVYAACLAVTLGLGSWTAYSMEERDQFFPRLEFPAAVLEELRSSPVETTYWVQPTGIPRDGVRLLRSDVPVLTGRSFIVPPITPRMLSYYSKGDPLHSSSEGSKIGPFLYGLCPVVLFWRPMEGFNGIELASVEDMVEILNLEIIKELGDWTLARPEHCAIKAELKARHEWHGPAPIGRREPDLFSVPQMPAPFFDPPPFGPPHGDPAFGPPGFGPQGGPQTPEHEPGLFSFALRPRHPSPRHPSGPFPPPEHDFD